MSDTVLVPEFDRSEGLIHFATWQDCEAILERNKRLQGEQQRDEFWHHQASIPNVIITQWLYEEHERGNVNLKWSDKEFDQIIMRKLRDPDWKWLRVGKL